MCLSSRRRLRRIIHRAHQPDAALDLIGIRLAAWGTVALYASFHSSDRCPIRLQCSVAKIATASGPSGWSLTGVGTAVPRSAAGAAASPGAGALPVLSVASIPLLGRGVRVAVHVHSCRRPLPKLLP